MEEQRRWTRLGASEPYFAVCTEPRFRRGSMTEADVAAFFQSGEREMSSRLETIRRLRGGDAGPARSLDFGCGVGRLTIPLARASGAAVGVDISPSMLAEAARNCAARGVGNVEFRTTGEFMADRSLGNFEMVHSFIVFQHIEPELGLRITATMLDRLNVGGIAALHYTVGNAVGGLRRAIYEARRLMPPANALANLVNGRPISEPMVLMHCYDVTVLDDLFRAQRCTTMHTESTEHGGYQGTLYYLRKEPQR